MMGFGLLVPILLIAILAYTLGWRPQFSNQVGGPNSREQDEPLAILRRRYARGEISRDEFDRMRQDLTT
jgi:putative membrane protein